MLTTLIEETRLAIARSLAEPELARVAAALDGPAGDTCDRLTETVTTDNGVQARLKELRVQLLGEITGGPFERVLVLRQAERALTRMGALPVGDDCKRLFCEEFQYVAQPPVRAKFDVTRGSFVTLCEVATLRRFPAGLFHWTNSGLPRSWVAKVTGRDRLRLLYWVARKLKGFGPVFFPHLNPNRKQRWLTELAANRSYYCMAQSLILQPDVKGMVASSWLRSPDTYAVSPELAWMNKTILENGGLAVVMGPADPGSGVLTRSPTRQKAYEAGVFKPTNGLVIWPRDAMIAWAAQHPELSVN
jgi:hypothetical protein